MRKDLRKLRRKLKEQGFEVYQNRGSVHLTVRKDGKRVATIPSTPSEYRSSRNTIADLKRAGFRPT